MFRNFILAEACSNYVKKLYSSDPDSCFLPDHSPLCGGHGVCMHQLNKTNPYCDCSAFYRGDRCEQFDDYLYENWIFEQKLRAKQKNG